MMLLRNYIFGAFLILALFGGTAIANAETMHYRIMQMGIKIGEAYLIWVGPVVYRGKDALLVRFKADGFNFLDEEQIYLDPATLKPLFVERNLNIFGSREKILEEGEIRITKQNGEASEVQVLKKVGSIDNIYGFIFRYRKSGSFAVGDVIDVNLPTKDLKIQLVKQVSIAAGGQTYNSFYMQSKPAKYKIWFSTDAKRLPLRISGAVGIANTMMVMADYKE
jgi:hypothetical protein